MNILRDLFTTKELSGSTLTLVTKHRQQRRKSVAGSTKTSCTRDIDVQRRYFRSDYTVIPV